MARIKIDLPGKFYFSTKIPVRITDINYGGHVGNDTVLTLIHEARMQYFKSLGYTEMDFAGVGTIMSEAAIEFKKELFYDETVLVSVTAGEISKVSFELFYKLEKVIQETEYDKKNLVAVAKTGMVCFDYKKKKIIAVPEKARQSLIG
jgi:YbgC/YbaW family acyl-CoA thioester hydrolase